MKVEQPTNSELEILTVLWEKGKATAREVHNEISKTKSTGYTTTLKTMQNMFDKGLLGRKPDGQKHIYHPAVERKAVQQVMLGGFVNKLFRGSSKELILQALGNQQPTKEELNEIREMLNQLENKTK